MAKKNVKKIEFPEILYVQKEINGKEVYYITGDKFEEHSSSVRDVRVGVYVFQEVKVVKTDVSID